MDHARWHAIIFDLDDTLYPELEYVRSGFREVARWFSRPLGLVPDAIYQELMGVFEDGFRRNTFDVWVEKRGLSTELAEKMVTIYRDHPPKIEPFPGVKEMLIGLRCEFRLGLLSDGALKTQERKLVALDIHDVFDAVVFSDKWGRESWKPSLQPYLAILSALGMNAGEAVYVGDNPVKDFVACRRLGMRSVWLQQPAGVYADRCPQSVHHEPDHVVFSIDELASLLWSAGATGQSPAPELSTSAG